MTDKKNNFLISEDESNDELDECQRDLTKDGGILKSIVQGGKRTSKPKLGEEVLFHVVGTLKKEGKVFLNTRKLEKPIRDILGSKSLVDAFNIALLTMKLNEISILTCEPTYCYKNENYFQNDFECEVPSNSVIVYEVELLDFNFNDCSKKKDKSVLRVKLLEEGDGIFYPIYNSEVNCDIISFYDFKNNFIDKISFEKKNFSWILGEGCLQDIPKHIEYAIESMIVNEKSIFKIKKNYLTQNIQKNCSQDYVYFQIRLNSCIKAKEYYEMSKEERFNNSLDCKLKGNYYLTENFNIRLALKRFKRAIDLLECSIDLDKDLDLKRDELLFSCYMNISKAYFLAKTLESSYNYLMKALQMKPNDEKALYRLGIYLISVQKFTEAKTQFEKILSIYKDNKAAKNKLIYCMKMINEQLSNERNLCKLMCKALTK